MERGAESLRQFHLKTERSLKSIGVFFILSGVILIAGLPFALHQTLTGTEESSPSKFVFLAIFTLVAISTFPTGLSLLKLKPSARRSSIILSVFGLFAFPVGTLINIGILFELTSKRAGIVLDENYRLAIDQTPHLQSSPSRIVTVCSIIIGGFVALSLMVSGLAALMR